MASHSPATISAIRDESAKMINKACDLCRKKKIRCELMEEGCAQCNKYNKQCSFTPVEMKKGPRRPPGYKLVEGLEKRLKRMEAMLQAQNSIQVERSEVESGDQTVSVYVNKKRKTRHSPPDSSESLHIQNPVWRQSGRTSENLISDSLTPGTVVNKLQLPVSYWSLATESDLFARRTFKHLPPKDEARLLIQEAFECFNTAFPIFHQESFLSTFETRYVEDGRDDPGWWACLNVVFALAHRFRAMITRNNLEDFQASGYLQNALAVVTELTMRNPELLAVQAIIGMAIVLQGTPNPRPCSVLVSTALRLAQSMKLHRRDQGHGLSAIEIEQRKRVFWMAYIMDKDISLRTGDPPAQDDDDMDVDLPTETFNFNPISVNGINFFSLRIGLAIIQGQIYKSLSSAEALRHSDAERALDAKELDAMLDVWKRSVPVDFASDDSCTTVDTSSLPCLVHKVILKFTYFNTLSTLHRFFPVGSHLHIESAEPMPRPRPRGVSVVLSDAICLAEARNSMQLLPAMPQGDYACVWLLLHHFFLASKAILSHVISNSVHTLGKEDLKLVHPMLELLNELGNRQDSLGVEEMKQTMAELLEEANEVVSHVKGHKKKALDSRDKPRNEDINVINDKESVEDFILRIESSSAAFG